VQRLVYENLSIRTMRKSTEYFSSHAESIAKPVMHLLISIYSWFIARRCDALCLSPEHGPRYRRPLLGRSWHYNAKAWAQ